MAVRLDDGGPCGTRLDREAGGCAHLLLITLGRIRVDSSVRRWSLDSPDSLVSRTVMNLNGYILIVIASAAGPGFEFLTAHPETRRHQREAGGGVFWFLEITAQLISCSSCWSHLVQAGLTVRARRGPFEPHAQLSQGQEFEKRSGRSFVILRKMGSSRRSTSGPSREWGLRGGLPHARRYTCHRPRRRRYLTTVTLADVVVEIRTHAPSSNRSLAHRDLRRPASCRAPSSL